MPAFSPLSYFSISPCRSACRCRRACTDGDVIFTANIARCFFFIYFFFDEAARFDFRATSGFRGITFLRVLCAFFCATMLTDAPDYRYIFFLPMRKDADVYHFSFFFFISARIFRCAIFTLMLSTRGISSFCGAIYGVFTRCVPPFAQRFFDAAKISPHVFMPARQDFFLLPLPMRTRFLLSAHAVALMLQVPLRLLSMFLSQCVLMLFRLSARHFRCTMLAPPFFTQRVMSATPMRVYSSPGLFFLPDISAMICA